MQLLHFHHLHTLNRLSCNTRQLHHATGTGWDKISEIKFAKFILEILMPAKFSATQYEQKKVKWIAALCSLMQIKWWRTTAEELWLSHALFFLCTAADHPSDLTAEQLPQQPGSFRISWTPPASSANLTGYHIYYSGADDSGSVDVGASATNITIDSRRPGVTYTITMVALSSHLPSPVVGPLNVTLPGGYCALFFF